MADPSDPFADRLPALARALTDDYAPPEIAKRIETAGLAKAAMPFVPLAALAVLAGAFIAFGAVFYIMAVTGSTLGLGPTRLLGGVAFSLGLILVVVGGGELFTGNILIVMGWANRRIAGRAMLRNWAIAYAGNLVGALGTALLVWWSGVLGAHDHAAAVTAVRVAAQKTALGLDEAFVRGILCNVLVCLAVWLSFAAHSVNSKILAIVFPIAAFVGLGFEHSVANMFAIPLGWLAALDPEVARLAGLQAEARAALGPAGFLKNLAAVTAGNVVGGGLLVALVYYVIYLRPPAHPP